MFLYIFSPHFCGVRFHGQFFDHTTAVLYYLFFIISQWTPLRACFWWMIYAKSAKYLHRIIFFTTIVIFVDKICTLTSLAFSTMRHSMSFSILRQNKFPFYMDILHQVLLFAIASAFFCRLESSSISSIATFKWLFTILDRSSISISPYKCDNLLIFSSVIIATRSFNFTMYLFPPIPLMDNPYP